MNAAFADAFYFVALLNRSDQHHTRVRAFAAAPKRSLVTTMWVLTEVADAFAASGTRRRIAAFIIALERDCDIRIVPASAGLFSRGLEIYDDRPDKGWTLTDCISFVVMADENLTDALTGDHHFEQAGFNALLG